MQRSEDTLRKDTRLRGDLSATETASWTWKLVQEKRDAALASCYSTLQRLEGMLELQQSYGGKRDCEGREGEWSLIRHRGLCLCKC